MISLFVFLITILIIFLIYCYNLSNYWKNRGIPGPRIRRNFIENQASYLFDPYNPNGYVFRDWTKKYGKVYGYMEGTRKVLVISDPELAQEILVKKFEYFHGRKLNPIVGDVEKLKRTHVFNAKGGRWKRLRTISNPCFSVSSLKKIFPILEDTANNTVKLLENELNKDDGFNIHRYFHEYTMDIICRIALGQKESKMFQNPYVEMFTKILFKFANNPVDYVAHLFPPLGPYLKVVFQFMLSYFTNVPIEEFFKKTYETIYQRQQIKKESDTVSKQVDFIDLFLEAEDPRVVDQEYKKTGMKISKHLTVEEVGGMCFIFLIAGFDTTANTLGVTFYYLSRYPDIQQKLIDEIDEAFPDDDDRMSYDQVNGLKYADCVMKEALRMYPIAANVVNRECQERVTLSNGLEIEPGVCIQFDLHSMHYNREIWGDDVDEFKPERFYNFTVEQQQAYYPFGGGLRTCIGMRLAYLEEKLLLAKFFKKYRVGLPSTEKINDPPKMIGVVLQNPESVNVVIKKHKKI